MNDVAAQRADLDRRAAGRPVSPLFADTVEAHPDRVALRWRDADGDTWHELTWAEYADQALRLAGALADLGIGHGDRVVLMVRNRPEFHVADIAVVLCGA